MVREQLRVAVALSGGVDSAVVASLLKEQGYEVIGVHLRFCGGNPRCGGNDFPGVASRCGGGKAEQSARAVAKHLDIPLIVWDLRDLFQQKVINPFFGEYRKGKTPSPCTVCNRELKFGAFLEKVLKDLPAQAGLKVDKIATGHYARVFQGSGRYRLLRGVDERKDQSYFLWTLTQEKLQHILFPIGELTRKEVEAKAKELDLPCAKRPKSQGICFVGSEDIARFLREQLPVKKGPVEDIRGNVIGEHDGVWFYTEGQRHGFRVKSEGKSQKAKVILPLYVVKKDVKTNTLIVGRGKESEVSGIKVKSVNWIVGRQKAKRTMQKVGVRIRHLGEILPAGIKVENGKSVSVELLRPTRGVAPGQSAVFYGSTHSPRGCRDEVLGGGIIKGVGGLTARRCLVKVNTEMGK